MNWNLIQELKQFLIKSKENLFWDFVNKNSKYDSDICKILWMKENTCRYWDAEWNWLKIEFKKWKSIWLDLIRYSEILVWINNNAEQESFTLFFIPDKNRDKIIEIIWVSTKEIIKRLSLDIKTSEKLIELNDRMPRSLNAQASLTVRDIRNIADFVI